MHTRTNRLEFAPPPTPGLVRSVALAVLAHAFLVAALTLGVNWKRDAVAPLTAEAELWSAVPQEAAPPLVEVPAEPEPPAPPVEPPPAPTPPPPAPPQVEPKLPDPDIALEKLRQKKEKEKEKQRALDKEKALEKQHQEKLKLEKIEKLEKLEKLKQEKLLQEKHLLEQKRLQDKRDMDKKAAEDKKKSEQDSKHKATQQAQQDAKKQEIQREANLKRMAGLAGGTGSPTSTGTAQQSSGPSASYGGKIRARIKPNIVFTEDIAGNPMAEVEVRTSPDGTIISRKLIKTSGDKSWDDAVLKAIDKTEVLPRDVDGRVPPSLIISFRPKD